MGGIGQEDLAIGDADIGVVVLGLGNLGEAIPRTDFYYVDAYASGESGLAPVILQAVYARRYSN